MNASLEAARGEVEALHVFFVDWFRGAIGRDRLAPDFLDHMDPGLTFVSPDGRAMDLSALRVGFEAGYGANPDFRIQVRDVAVQRRFGDVALVTYTEWQKGARNSARAENGRISTALIAFDPAPRWLHLHETWLPAAAQSAEAYAF